MLLPPADAIPFSIGGATTGQLVSGRGVLLGWSLEETGGVAASTVRFRDGAATAGYILGHARLAISGVDRFFYPMPCVQAAIDMTFEAIGAGVVSGSVFIVPETRWNEFLTERWSHGGESLARVTDVFGQRQAMEDLERWS